MSYGGKALFGHLLSVVPRGSVSGALFIGRGVGHDLPLTRQPLRANAFVGKLVLDAPRVALVLRWKVEREREGGRLRVERVVTVERESGDG